MNNEEKERLTKELQGMNVIDNFLFSEILTDEIRGKKACRLILSRVLNREIGEVEFTPEKVVPGISEKTHGIRMDAYITERAADTENGADNIRIFDVEPDNKESKKSELPKRSRYYADLIDVQLLETSVDYDKLPELVTIFILSYDPFGANALVYEAGSVLKTHPDRPYDDGIRRIYLYVDGELTKDATEDEKKLQALLKYIGNSTEENVTDETTKELDDIVKKVKAKPGIGVRYMKSWELEREFMEAGRAEERQNTEAERKRADAAENRAKAAESRIKELEAKIEELTS